MKLSKAYWINNGLVGDKKAIIEGVLYFIENPDKLTVFGNKNRENIENNFSLQVFSEKFEKEISQ